MTDKSNTGVEGTRGDRLFDASKVARLNDGIAKAATAAVASGDIVVRSDEERLAEANQAGYEDGYKAGWAAAMAKVKSRSAADAGSLYADGKDNEAAAARDFGKAWTR